MYPELLKIGPITIYSYGFMLGVAFLIANFLITNELKRLKLDVSIATSVTMMALIGGIVGAKLFHVFENWSDFLQKPIQTVFSSGGLTWYGGFLLATMLVFSYFRRKKFSMIRFADIAAPALGLGYGLGRVGCQLAGDGDYGIPSMLPWAMKYTNGTVPTLSAINIELADKFRSIYPNIPVPVDIAVHPTPVYEFLLAAALFAFLYFRRTKEHPLGNQFGWFLVFHSLTRFGIEFIRLNPHYYFGLSEAQLISIPLIVWGVYLIQRKAPRNQVQKNQGM